MNKQMSISFKYFALSFKLIYLVYLFTPPLLTALHSIWDKIKSTINTIQYILTLNNNTVWVEKEHFHKKDNKKN